MTTPIAIVPGCFDVFHPGHYCLLSEAETLTRGPTGTASGLVIVALATDYRVMKIKDRGPRDNFCDRSLALIATGLVSAVVPVNTAADELALVRKLCPNWLVKGSDYIGKQIVGQHLLEERGGVVHFVPLLLPYGTSAPKGQVETRP